MKCSVTITVLHFRFGDILEKLSEVPVLSTLMQNADSRPFGVFDTVLTNAYKTSTSGINTSNEEATSNEGASAEVDETTMVPETSVTSTRLEVTEKDPALKETDTSENEQVGCISILDWLSASGHKTLKNIAEECHQGAEQLEKIAVPSLRENFRIAIELSKMVTYTYKWMKYCYVVYVFNIFPQDHMKEVKGLGDRLSGLELMMLELRRIEKEQTDLTQSFQQNQMRAGSLGDTSILPDLCATHRSQLLVMLDNQRKMRDYRRRCIKAKEELNDNLSQRLRYDSDCFNYNSSVIYFSYHQ